MKKKVLALCLAAAMTATAFAGCGSDAADTTGDAAGTTSDSTGADASSDSTSDGTTEVEQVSLKVWVPEEEMEITQSMCDAFNEAHPEYDCTFDIAVVGIDESVSQLETDPDIAADVFQMPSGSISQLNESGLLYPITVDIDNVKSLYGEGALEACTRDDLLYGIPFSPNSWFMFYNKSLYTEEEVKSLDTMMAKDLGDDVYNFSCSLSNSWYLEAFFYAAGCTLYGEDGMDPTDCSWNDENGLAAANYVIELANNAKYVEDLDGIAGSLMKEGKLGALCSGTWSAPELQEVLGDDFGACALPTVTINGKECQLSNFADYKCFAVKSNTAYPKAAQELAEWLTNEENQLTRYSVAGESPTALSLLDNEEVAADIATCALLEQTQYATPQPSISQIDSYWTPVAALGEGIINGEITSANIQEKLDVVASDVTSTLTE
jgi:arabinogalactan oligomer/maltooligosaccharide transport system substrate-binding protein